ncbi:hypothetical protein RvY_08222 [Ramazzottius varieornatus]|uniref:Uncharacterized protein n=1 Tax=Ramazzottius varieornatus TaxID=947166 RepID=A0A1D1V541_RAMVA|nr:hypothetical protein RvY_08222 [Ramazzottius varieornatus]
MEQLDNQQLAEGPGSVPKSDVRPGDAGDLGVDIASYQPAAVAPAVLHLHQVSENAPGHVGHEPASHALPKVKTDLVPPQQQEQDPSYHSRDPYPHAPVESGTGSGSSQKGSGSHDQAGASQKSANNQEQAGGAKEGMLGQMAHKAAELYEGVKGTVAPALENVKEKASEAWHAVAGTIGAGPGPELKEDYTERVVAGQETQSSKEGASSNQGQHEKR